MSPTAGESSGLGTPVEVGVGVEVEVERQQSSSPDSEVLAAAWDALRGVYDPELCLDLVSLGLIYRVAQDDGRLVVEMTLTTLGCPAAESLPEMARQAVVDALRGVVEVDVRLVWDPPWSPAMIDDATGSLGFRGR